MRNSEEHSGYDILRKWCCQDQFPVVVSEPTKRRRIENCHETLDNQCEGVEGLGKYFIYTSNTDGHFRRRDRFDRNRIFEIHGCNLEWQCGRFQKKSDGAIEPTPCCPEVMSVPEDYRFCVEYDKDGVAVAPESLRPLNGFGSNRPTCPRCGSLARPNSVNFDDQGYVRSRQSAEIESSYRKWIAQVTERCRAGTHKLLILEMGCGTFVPSIRSHIDCVMGDVYPSQITSSDGLWPSMSEEAAVESDQYHVNRATVVRINPSSALCDFEATPARSPRHFLHLQCGCLEALEMIDAEFSAMKIKPTTATSNRITPSK